VVGHFPPSAIFHGGEWLWEVVLARSPSISLVFGQIRSGSRCWWEEKGGGGVEEFVSGWWCCLGVKTERIRTDSSETIFVTIFFSESERIVCGYEYGIGVYR
jgi:hypothetical protein